MMIQFGNSHQCRIMKRHLILIVSLFINGVFGDETETVSVNDGGSVTLHTHLTELQTDDVIAWRFNGTRIARINRAVKSDPVYDSDERFAGKLKMNPQTGDLTITNITSELTGLYKLDITSETQTFSVSLSRKVKIVKERDSVSLHIDVTEEQRNDKIHWKIKHNNSPVAEIIKENGKISTPFIEERFRDRLKLDVQTGDLIITHMKNEDSGQYEADVTIGSNTHTIHKTFSFTDSAGGFPSGAIAGICVALLLVIAAAAVVTCNLHHHLRSSYHLRNSGKPNGSNNGNDLEEQAMNETSVASRVTHNQGTSSDLEQINTDT